MMWTTWVSNGTGWTGDSEWPTQRQCQKSESGAHEWVHVGFMHLTFACKHCDQDAPEGYQPDQEEGP